MLKIQPIKRLDLRCGNLISKFVTFFKTCLFIHLYFFNFQILWFLVTVFENRQNSEIIFKVTSRIIWIYLDFCIHLDTYICIWIHLDTMFFVSQDFQIRKVKDDSKLRVAMWKTETRWVFFKCCSKDLDTYDQNCSTSSQIFGFYVIWYKYHAWKTGTFWVFFQILL